MPHWNSRGLRGSSLEELINLTNTAYREKKLAVIQKVPTPITPVEISRESRTISLAYFEAKSTVDYIGVVQGIAICFDAKETTLKSLPIQNIHEHQIEFMKAFQEQKGLAFVLVHFLFTDEYFYLPFDTLYKFYAESKNGGRKSIPYKAFDSELIIKSKGNFLVHYLEAINIVLSREGTEKE